MLHLHAVLSIEIVSDHFFFFLFHKAIQALMEMSVFIKTFYIYIHIYIIVWSEVD